MFRQGLTGFVCYTSVFSMKNQISFFELPEPEQAFLCRLVRCQLEDAGLRSPPAAAFDRALAVLRDPASQSWRRSIQQTFGVSVPGLMQAAAVELYPEALPLLDPKKSPPERALMLDS